MKWRIALRSLALGIWAFFSGAEAFSLTIPTLAIDQPGNAADIRYRPSGIGYVQQPFRIGMTEVTNAQYVEFLNSVAISDPYLLFSSASRIIQTGSPGSYSYSVMQDPGQPPGGLNQYFANKPVTNVSWYSALRFVNWLHNGQANGDTETGAYAIGEWDFVRGKPVGTPNITRNSNARWFLPTEDEWYKAAYFDPNAAVYYDYPMGTNALPNNNYPQNDTGNSGNFYHGNGVTEMFTDVGAYMLSASPYGTFDQGGNAWEWTETPFAGTNPPLVARIARGESAFDSFSQFGHASRFVDRVAASPLFDVGFRIATVVPEPASSPVAALGLLLLMRVRKCSICGRGASTSS